MQEYLHRSRLGERMDALGLRLVLGLLCLGWFILLWGLTLPSLTAGLALDSLVLILLRKSRDGRLKRREQRLRCRIGGEMALERLLIADPGQAHFEVAMLLSLRYPLTLLQSGEEGVLCARDREKILVAFFQLPSGGTVTAEHVLRLQRAAHRRGADRAVLCAPCGIDPKAREQAENMPAVTFFPREGMIDLFGGAQPATDEQLVALGRRKRRRHRGRAWLRWILDRRRAPRYAFYGALLLSMYVLTRLPYYALPGLICVFLAAACRCVREEKNGL